MSDNRVKISVGADLTQTDAALDAFAGRASESFEKVGPAIEGVTGQTESLNRGILNSHQSVHLLAEELGIHLPRAVVSGVSEMLPSIDAVGPALLGAFSVDMLVKFGEGLHELYDDFDGVTRAEKEMADYASQNLSILEKEARASTEIARTELHRVQMAAAAAASDENRLEAAKDTLEFYMGPMAAGFAKLAGLTDKSNEAHAETIRLQTLAAKMADIFTEDEVRDYKEAASAARKAAEEEERRSEQSYDYFAKRRAEDKRAAEEYAREAAEMAAIDERQVELLREEDGWRIKVEGDLAKENSEMLKGINLSELSSRMIKRTADEQKRLSVEWANAHPLAANIIKDLKSMGIEEKNTSVAKMELTAVTHQFTRATTDEIMAVQKNIAASGEQLAAGLAGLIGGRKAQAAVEAVWEVARGIACIAEGTWPPNPAAIIAAGLHFEAAAQYAILAGSGGGSRSAGSASAGSQSSYGRDTGHSGGGGSASVPSQALAPGAAGASAAAQTAGPTEIHLHFNAPIYGGPSGMSELATVIARPMASALSRVVTTSDVRLVASHAVNPATVSRGRP